MNVKPRLLLPLLALLLAVATQAADPLRVFIRAGVKTHGPNQHDHPTFLNDWQRLLAERGAKVDGAMEFPSPQQLANTDVLVIYAQDGMRIVGEQRSHFETFLRRGGGLVVIHDGVVSGDQHEWAKQVQGGAWVWENKKTKWHEGEVGLYFVDTTHPIVKGLSNFDWQDEIYYDLEMAPEARVLATSFHSVHVLAPQLWTYEQTWAGGSAPYRAFVSLPGHEYVVFNTPHYRAILLRGIAWAGKHESVDALCRPEELANLKYPAGGPTPPEQAAAKLNHHPDFDLSLVASEPLVEKVISLDWDPQGRLWVAETPEYPNGRSINKNDSPIYPARALDPAKYAAAKVEDRPARDRISWLEDTDGDGRMDKKHVFYEGLELVTSLVFYKDGVIVEQAPDILWLRDTDGDGKADKVEKLYTGFGTFDTHAVINNMRWGLDGWVYSAIGYSSGDPKSPDGSKSFGRIPAGVFRFKPDGSAVEQIASGSCNTWGFDFAPDGEMYYTTATCGEHLLHVVMPEKVLARGNVGGIRASAVIPDHQKIAAAVHHKRPAYVQIDWVGAFTAAAGACFYNGGAWPDRFNNHHFLTEPTVSLVHNDVLTPQGATYLAKKEAGQEDTEFIAGTDLWFRPIHARVGPDGALYVVDFYNQAAVHNDTRGPAHGARNAATRPDRDHHFARIWRMQAKQPKPLPPWKFAPNDPAGLVKLLEHPNGWVRWTAHRLLLERGAGDQAPTLVEMIKTSANPLTRMHALYALSTLGQLEDDLFLAAINDRDAIVRKNALRLASERDNSSVTPNAELVRTRLNDSDPRARLYAFIALGTCELSPEIAQAVVEVWPNIKDKYILSAAVGVAAKEPLLFMDAAFNAKEPAFLADFVSHVARLLATKQDAALAARLVVLLAKQPAGTDALKRAALETLSATLRADVIADWNPELQAAFAAFLKSSHPDLPGTVLPLIARWDKGGSLASELQPVSASLSARLQDASLADDRRGQIAVNLLGVRKLDPRVIPAVAKLVGSDASLGLQQRVVEALGGTAEIAAAHELIAAYPRVPDALREVIFGQLVKRAEWTRALLQAMTEHRIEPATLGPGRLHRLRNHADQAVAAKAKDALEALRSPGQKEKDALLAQFRPVVEQPGGNVENGHKLFTANCAVCHVFKNEGRDLAPNLTGMGAHGAGDLLVHILDPNRLVEPNFLSASIETKDDLAYDGVIARENNVELVLRNATADYTIRKDNISTRRTTSLSLMPEGFEALGAEGLRDLLAYVCADENRFRILDLTSLFTANTSQGIYNSTDAKEETLKFRRFGIVKVGAVTFDVLSPTKSPTGNNVLVLKGGAGLAKTFPQKVEVKAGFAARRLHFLGGIGGWAWPYGGDSTKNLPVTKVTLHFAGGGTEEIILRNGVEVADYIGKFQVPGSQEVPDLLHGQGQVRWFTKEVQGTGVIQSVTLESYDNGVAPTLVGITAELTDAAKIRTLIVGAGSSHDFKRWFLEEDSKTLAAGGQTAVVTTDKPSEVPSHLSNLDVLYLSNNEGFPSPAARQAIEDFANSGHGLLLVHPALWYNWADWPDYNRVLCGGGSRGHDRLGEFEVVVTEPDHPLMKGVPAKFKISDELYWFEADPEGTPIKVLATAYSPAKNKTYPSVFVVLHPKTRIVGITLGHDGLAHNHPAYQRLLQNAVVWAAEQKPMPTAGK